MAIILQDTNTVLGYDIYKLWLICYWPSKTLFKHKSCLVQSKVDYRRFNI